VASLSHVDRHRGAGDGGVKQLAELDILGAAYWTRGLRMYEKANKIHK